MLPGVLETGLLPSSQLSPSLCTSSARDGRGGVRGALCTDTTLAANAAGPAFRRLLRSMEHQSEVNLLSYCTPKQSSSLPVLERLL